MEEIEQRLREHSQYHLKNSKNYPKKLGSPLLEIIRRALDEYLNKNESQRELNQ